MENNSSYSTIIEATDLYIEIEKNKASMIKDVFPRARAIQPEWRGGGFYDALKILGETAPYDLAMNIQNGLLELMGIERYYDLENHDNTIDVLKITKRILTFHNSQPKVMEEE